MGKPTKDAVAAAIGCLEHRGQLLLVKRPEEPGEDLPGIWGLPAASLAPSEEHLDAVRRLGRQKLGLALEPVRLLARGHQEREGHTLRMWLYEAIADRGEPALASSSTQPTRASGPPRSTAGVTYYTGWRWDGPEALAEGAAASSLCCRLFLECRP